MSQTGVLVHMRRFTLGHFQIKIEVTWSNAILHQNPRESLNIVPLENLVKTLFVKLVVYYSKIHLFESTKSSLQFGFVWKMVNTWPQKFLCYPLSKIDVFDFLISSIFRKKSKKWKTFLVNSRWFCFAFHANLMSDGKKKRLKFLFITPLILLINMSISLFRWTV